MWKICKPCGYLLAWESWEKLGKIWGKPLGLEILGEARENLQNLGTLGVPLGLET